MDSIELDLDEECMVETSAYHFLSPGSPGANDVCGEPPILPRVGDQYQVEIPSLMTESERLQLKHSPISTKEMFGADYFIRIGLTIPITWTHHVVDHVKHEQQGFSGTAVGAYTSGLVDPKHSDVTPIDPKCSTMSGYAVESSNQHDTLPQGSTCKQEVLDDPSDLGSANQDCSAVDDKMDLGLFWLQVRKAKGYRPIPDSPVISWSDAETHSFLLGLYIFGKNLVQIRKFIEKKEMGNILSFYYGKFYRSDAHRRWSECRKIRSRRCIHGQRIFTGWRQQELLSRLLPRVSKEGHDALLEATKTFSEGRASLEEFVFILKAMVGMEVLVEAIGIGKGKHDLTGIILDPVRTNQVISIRPEIPVGKACSSLTCQDIIKFLTGDYRLSKARSNDLFWEAVWPRLLARGWHSEQPKDLVPSGSKHALVFLIPGIKKFSRKKLVKGNHYFDSVSDVLNKVASDPRLLELEVEESKENSNLKDECKWDMDTKSNQNGLSDHQRHCYLRPRLSNCNSELLKFTVVDTSLVQGEAPFKVRELRSLPIDATYAYGPSTRLGDTDSDGSTELPDSAETSLNDQRESDPGVSDEKKLGNNTRCLASPPKQQNLDSDDQYCDLLNGKQSVKDIKCEVSHRVKSGQPNYLSPLPKRHRLTPCKYAGTGRRTYFYSRGHQLKKEEPHRESNSPKANNMIGSEVGPSQCKISTSSSSAKVSPDESSEYIIGGNCFGPFGTGTVRETVLSQEKPETRTLIDLNLPHFPPDYDTEDPCPEVAGSQDDLNSRELLFPLETKKHFDGSLEPGTSNGVPSEQQPTVNSRRQSTRNRPLTTKALEALASGLFTTRRRGRGTRAQPRSSRRARKTVGAPGPVPTTDLGTISSNFMDSEVGMEEEYSTNTIHTDMFTKSHVQSERKGTPELLGVP